MPEEEKKTDDATNQPQAGSDSPPADAGRGEPNEFNKAKYTAKTQKLAELNQAAEEAGFDDPADYIRDLEEKLETLSRSSKTETKTDQAPVQNDNSQLIARMEALEKKQAMALKQNTATMLNLMHSNYQRAQDALPKEERYGLTRKELNDFLFDTSNAFVINQISRELEAKGEDANWVGIAADLIHTKKQYAEITKKKAEAQEALKDTADSTKAMPTTAAPPTEGGKKKTPEQERAEIIAPDSRKKFD